MADTLRRFLGCMAPRLLAAGAFVVMAQAFSLPVALGAGNPAPPGVAPASGSVSEVPAPGALDQGRDKASTSHAPGPGGGGLQGLRPGDGKGKKTRSIPIVITADTMKADRTTKTVVFKGDVEAREDFLLCSDELRMEYEGKNEVRKIDAIGHVRIYRASGVARAERAVYDRRVHTLLLTGNASVERCADTVRGGRITLYLDDDSALVEGLGSGRVKARIIPESDCPGVGTEKKDGAGSAPKGIIDVENTHCKGAR